MEAAVAAGIAAGLNGGIVVTSSNEIPTYSAHIGAGASAAELDLLYEGVHVFKRNRRGFLDSRVMYIEGPNLWVGKSKGSATKRFPLEDLHTRLPPRGAPPSGAWLTMYRKNKAVGPQGKTMSGTVSTEKLLLRPNTKKMSKVLKRQGAADITIDIEALHRWLSAAVQERQNELTARGAPLVRAPARGALESGDSQYDGGGNGLSMVGGGSIALQGQLEKKEWRFVWRNYHFCLSGKQLSVLRGRLPPPGAVAPPVPRAVYTVVQFNDVQDRPGKRSNRFNFVVQAHDGTHRRGCRTEIGGNCPGCRTESTLMVASRSVVVKAEWCAATFNALYAMPEGEGITRSNAMHGGNPNATRPKTGRVTEHIMLASQSSKYD